MTGAAEAPPVAVARLRAVLDSAGFEVTHARADEAFGNRYEVWRGGRLRVRLVRDRGQWFVEAAPQDAADWFSPMVWRDHLDGGLGSLDTPDLEEQCVLVADRLDAMRTAADEDLGLTEALRNRRTDRWRARNPGLG